MNYFQAGEFNNYEKLDTQLLLSLDAIRGKYGKPFIIKSDYRTLEANKAAGGSETSLHLYGRAIDFVVSTVDDFRIVCWELCAVVLFIIPNRGWEFEVDSTNKHFHLGHFPDNRPSRLIVKG